MSAAAKRTDFFRAAAAMLVLAVLIGGTPLSLKAIPQSRETVITLDICHPVQTWTFSPVSVVAVFPDSPAIAPSLFEHYQAAATEPLKIRAADAPDTPPPKPFA